MSGISYHRQLHPEQAHRAKHSMQVPGGTLQTW